MNTEFIREIVDAPVDLWDIPELQDDVDDEFYDDDSRGVSFDSMLESGNDF